MSSAFTPCPTFDEALLTLSSISLRPFRPKFDTKKTLPGDSEESFLLSQMTAARVRLTVQSSME